MYRKSILIALIVAGFFTFYLFLRRGYVNLYILNKVAGSTAAVLAAVTLLLGPLSRMTNFFDPYAALRKPLGLLALGFALFHAIVSLFFLPSRFPLDWYQREIVPIAFAALAVAIWICLGRISTNAWLKKLGGKWRTYQSVGARIAFAAIFLHLVLLKYPGWIRWWNGQVKPSPELANPAYPPASLFVFVIMLGIILYRGILFLNKK